MLRLCGGEEDPVAMSKEAERIRQEQLAAQANELYERFGKPLERDHPDEFVAISPDGRSVLGATASQAGHRAREAFGPGNYVFKLGQRVVGKWR
jgi:hypothetical protein